LVIIIVMVFACCLFLQFELAFHQPSSNFKNKEQAKTITIIMTKKNFHNFNNSRFNIGMLLLLVQQLLFVQLIRADSNSDSDSEFSVNVTTSSNSQDTTIIFNIASEEIRVGPSIVAALAMVVGAGVCFYGYKLFRPTVFVCGFLLGGILIAGAANAIFKNQDYVGTATWIAFAVGGILFGFLVLCLYDTGIFLVGAAAGVFLAFTLNTAFGHKIYPSNPTFVLIVMAVLLGLLGGYLATKLEKPMIIVATSFIGADMLVWGVGYFLGDYPSGVDLNDHRVQDASGNWVYSIPSAWWGYLGGTILLFVVGMIVQFKKTGKGVNHSSSKAIPARPYADAATPRGTPQCGNPVSMV